MSLRRKLLLVALCTLALPIAGWFDVRQMESLLRDGQAQALVASAQVVARSLVVTRALPPAEGPGWYVQEAPTPITVDGYGDDWAPLTPWSQPFARRGQLLLAEDADGFYLHAQVADTHRTRADAEDANALLADHLILALGNAAGQRRYLLAYEFAFQVFVIAGNSYHGSVIRTIFKLWDKRVPAHLRCQILQALS